VTGGVISETAMLLLVSLRRTASVDFSCQVWKSWFRLEKALSPLLEAQMLLGAGQFPFGCVR
jgi:hypothetical protein